MLTFSSYTGLIHPREALRISIDKQEYCYHALEYKGIAIWFFMRIFLVSLRLEESGCYSIFLTKM
jgi:hypothetical protein